jgi:hypothetical protein
VTGQRPFTRRQVLQVCGRGLAAATLAALPGRAFGFHHRSQVTYAGTDDQLLDEIQKASFQFFWNEASSATGQVKDRASASGQDRRVLSSIAATGFGLTALCVADQRGYAKPHEIAERMRRTLRFILNQLPHEHGFFYHFAHIETGQRLRRCEVSSIDTSILLCGVLTARQHFADPEIKELATKIYERVDWPWMLNDGKTFSMGWLPESGFLKTRWERYCELMMLYLLAIGSPSHPVSPDTWQAWKRPKMNYMGVEYISGNDPLFTHQYSHAWFDFRDKRDDYANYFENSVKATKAHKLFCLSLSGGLPDYSEDLWGITASDSSHGYTAWGGPPPHGMIDGSIVPCAAGGSLPFLFEDCIRVLRTIRSRYPKAWTPYGFVDAFNPIDGWYDPDALGIDSGITMLMAENHRTGFVWETFMKNPEATLAMRKAGFRPE